MANPYLLAADNSPALLPLLRENPSLASGQDEHGYSLVHAAASYSQLDLLRALVREFNVDVNLRDEDNETALFVIETVDAARILIEELGADLSAKNSEGATARQKILEEGDFPDVAEYLRIAEASRANGLVNGNSVNGTVVNGDAALPPAPEGISVTMSTITPADANEAELNPEFRRRIEQLAERDDFHTQEGQAELRRLVQDAIAGEELEGRNVRHRRD